MGGCSTVRWASAPWTGWAGTSTTPPSFPPCIIWGRITEQSLKKKKFDNPIDKLVPVIYRIWITFYTLKCVYRSRKPWQNVFLIWGTDFDTTLACISHLVSNGMGGVIKSLREPSNWVMLPLWLNDKHCNRGLYPLWSIFHLLDKMSWSLGCIFFFFILVGQHIAGILVCIRVYGCTVDL